MHKIPFEHIDPTKFEHEYEYCCGTTCDKQKVEVEFKALQDKLTKIQEVMRDEYIINYHPHDVVRKIAKILITP